MRLNIPRLRPRKYGRADPQVTKRLRAIGAQSPSAVKARNARLDDLINDFEQTSWSKLPSPAPAGGDLNDALFSAVRSRQRRSIRSRDERTNKAGLLDASGNPQVSPILVRDACKCALCIDASDRQRNFSYSDIPSGIDFSTVSYVKNTGDTIVHWKSDAPPHQPGTSSIFDRKTTANLLKTFRNPRWKLYKQPQKLWTAESFNRETDRIDFNEYINDDDVLAQTMQLLWRDGLVFIDGVAESENSVSQIVNRMGPLMTTFYGPTWDVRSVPNAKNVAYTAKHLGFHMDLLYMREPPAFQFLHCIHNESKGGESRFADTFKAVDVLYGEDPSKVVDLMTHRVRYEYDNDGHFYSDAKPTILKRREFETPKRPTHNANFPLVMTDIEGVHWSPPFVGHLAPQRHNDLARLVSASKAFSNILERPEMVIEEKMDGGTCVIFDNLRVVHARNAFNLNSGRRWLRGAYLAKQDFVSKASALMERMPVSLSFHASDRSSDAWSWKADRDALTTAE